MLQEQLLVQGSHKLRPEGISPNLCQVAKHVEGDIDSHQLLRQRSGEKAARAARARSLLQTRKMDLHERR